MTSPDSPLIDFYPTNFETDLNEKKQEWEAIVLIPFIDEVLSYFVGYICHFLCFFSSNDY
jgi:5'-3' exonuclease